MFIGLVDPKLLWIGAGVIIVFIILVVAMRYKLRS
jgi:hypothetical protein